MFDNVFNNLEWKKIVSKEFISFKNYRQLIREKLIKENYKGLQKNDANSKLKKNFNLIRLNPKKDKNNEIILSKSISFFQNDFCFPIKENFIVSNCYTMKYIELFDNFEFFDKTMSNFFLKLKALYEFYPKTLDERERLDNKEYILWIFISCIKYLDDKNFVFNKNEDMIELIKKISEMLNKDFKYLYVFLSKYIIQLNNKIKSEKNNNSLTNYFNYRKYYCSVCKIYLCSKHFYIAYNKPEMQNNEENYFFVEPEMTSCYSQEINYIRPKKSNNIKQLSLLQIQNLSQKQ